MPYDPRTEIKKEIEQLNPIELGQDFLTIKAQFLRCLDLIEKCGGDPESFHQMLKRRVQECQNFTRGKKNPGSFYGYTKSLEIADTWLHEYLDTSSPEEFDLEALLTSEGLW